MFVRVEWVVVVVVAQVVDVGMRASCPTKCWADPVAV